MELYTIMSDFHDWRAAFSLVFFKIVSGALFGKVLRYVS